MAVSLQLLHGIAIGWEVGHPVGRQRSARSSGFAHAQIHSPSLDLRYSPRGGSLSRRPSHASRENGLREVATHACSFLSLGLAMLGAPSSHSLVSCAKKDHV